MWPWILAAVVGLPLATCSGLVCWGGLKGGMEGVRKGLAQQAVSAASASQNAAAVRLRVGVHAASSTAPMQPQADLLLSELQESTGDKVKAAAALRTLTFMANSSGKTTDYLTDMYLDLDLVTKKSSGKKSRTTSARRCWTLKRAQTRPWTLAQ